MRHYNPIDPRRRLKLKARFREATPETIERFKRFNARALAVLKYYNDMNARRMLREFKNDVILEGVDAAMDKWEWLIS